MTSPSHNPRNRIAAPGAALVLLAVGVLVWSLRAKPDTSRGLDAAVAEGDSDEGGSARVRPDSTRPTTLATRRFSAPSRTLRDRAIREEVRRRIWQAWAQSNAATGLTVDAGVDPRLAPMPTLDGGNVDPQYLRERIREDFLPMAVGCYNQLLERRPGVRGRVRLNFTIVGEPGVGGVVEGTALDRGDGGDAGALGDPTFATCLVESMGTLAFRPPPGRGTISVRYPFSFAPEPPDGEVVDR